MLKAKDKVFKSLSRRRFWMPFLLAAVILGIFLFRASLPAAELELPQGELVMDEIYDFSQENSSLHWVHYNVENANGSFYHQYMTEPQIIWAEIRVLEGGSVSVDVTRHIYHANWRHVFTKTDFFYVNAVLNLTMWGTYNFEFSGPDTTVLRIRIVVLESGKMVI